MSAQNFSKNAIGLRLGSGNGIGTEISYQLALQTNNRLEIDLGTVSKDKSAAVKITGIYQWVWELEDNFNWYAGAGAGLANASYDIDFPGLRNGDRNESFAYAVGQLGIEYNFNAPLLLSLDTRPQFSLARYGNNLNLVTSLGIRYQF